MEPFIAPTDSRWRGDIRLYEQDKLEEAEAEKIRIEVRQREQRKLIEEGKLEKRKPLFFREVHHPYLKAGDLMDAEVQPVFYDLVEGREGYWQRRERKDWDDMPDLWGIKEIE